MNFYDLGGNSKTRDIWKNYYSEVRLCQWPKYVQTLLEYLVMLEPNNPQKAEASLINSN